MRAVARPRAAAEAAAKGDGGRGNSGPEPVKASCRTAGFRSGRHVGEDRGGASNFWECAFRPTSRPGGLWRHAKFAAKFHYRAHWLRFRFMEKFQRGIIYALQPRDALLRVSHARGYRIKNGIVMVGLHEPADRAVRVRRGDVGGKSRLRPVPMTLLTTILGYAAAGIGSRWIGDLA